MSSPGGGGWHDTVVGYRARHCQPDVLLPGTASLMLAEAQPAHGE